MRKPKLRELREALKSLFSKPYTTRFPAEPSPAADEYRGKGEFNEEKCVACGACAELCPAKAIEVVDILENGDPHRQIIRHDDECIFCGHCEIVCTTEEGIKLTPEYDLATLDRSECRTTIEKELVLCELCGAPITTRDHLLWVARKLGAKRYANPTLILTAQRQLEVAEPPSPPPGDRAPDREDILRVLCPKCRRVVVLKEIWG